MTGYVELKIAKLEDISCPICREVHYKGNTPEYEFLKLGAISSQSAQSAQSAQRVDSQGQNDLYSMFGVYHNPEYNSESPRERHREPSYTQPGNIQSATVTIPPHNNVSQHVSINIALPQLEQPTREQVNNRDKRILRNVKCTLKQYTSHLNTYRTYIFIACLIVILCMTAIVIAKT
jgi:hypothetical protein